jgi:hypothetical protein
MNRNYRRVPTEFGPETRFEVRPEPPTPFRGAHDYGLERLKNRLLAEYIEELTEPRHNVYVRRAANEAAALAWVTPYPLLVFPGLFEERTHGLLRQAVLQDDVRRRSRELMPV